MSPTDGSCAVWATEKRLKNPQKLNENADSPRAIGLTIGLSEITATILSTREPKMVDVQTPWKY